MAVLTVTLYSIAILVSIVVALLLLLLSVPVRYRVQGKYESTFTTRFTARCSPLLAIRGSWDGASTEPMLAQIVVAGLSFSLDPEKQSKSESKKKGKKQSKKKKGKDLPLLAVLRCLTREFIGTGKTLLGDLLKILRPTKVEIEGRCGFDEPHLTGWLAVITSMVKECYGWISLDIEPVWQEEHYEFSMIIEGRVALCIILYRLARFGLARPTRQFLKMMKKEKTSYAA